MLNSHKFDLITLSETWLKDNPTLLDYVEIAAYKKGFRNRDRVRGGGVGYYIKSNIKAKERKDLDRLDDTIEHKWIEIKGKNKASSVLVGIMYQPSSKPRDKLQWLEKFETLLSQITVLYDGPIVITGDFNIDLLSQSQERTVYEDILSSFNLIQHVKHATRKSKSLISHIITTHNIKSLQSNIVFCDEISDHDAPFCILKISKTVYEPRYRYIRDERTLNMNNFINDFLQLPLNLVYVFDSVTDKVSVLNQLITDCIDHHAPLRRVKITRPPAPWMKDLHISNLQRKRNQMRKNYRANRNQTNHLELKNVRNELKSKIKQTKRTFLKKLLSNKNSSETWRVIKKILHPNPSKVNVDPNEVNSFFNQTAVRTTGKLANEINDNFINDLPHNPNSFGLRVVTHEEVQKAIKSLRSDCSTGFDNIPTKFVKAVADLLASPVTHNIKNCIQTSTVPDDWKVSRICPVPKVENPKSISEFRPINILPILSKVFERVILQQITEQIEARSIYNPKQSGFRKGHSTTTILLKLKDDIQKAMKKGEVTLAILADFSKAFDTVDYQTLLKQLNELGFSKDLLLLLKDYLSNRQQFVQVDDKCSSRLPVEFGVPQGSILGPILFNLYVTTICLNGNSSYLLYADDTTLLRHAKPKDLPKTVEEMQKELANITNWSEKRNLSLNALKTKTVLFSTSQLSRVRKLDDVAIQLTSNNKQLERVFHVKILGVYFNQHLTWANHVNFVTRTCYATLRSLRIFRRTADFNLRKTLAESLILSRLNYCNVLLSDAPQYILKRLQKVQNAAAHFVLGHRARVNDVIKLKWLPIEESISSSLAKLAHKALHDTNWPGYLSLSTVAPRARVLRSTAVIQGNVDTSTGVEGTFTVCAGRTFNDLPNNVKVIEDYNIFKRKCLAFYHDKALSRIMSLDTD